MPQKRNPYALAAIRAQAGQAAGDVTAALTVAHTGSARTDHFHLLNGLVPRALEEAGAIGRLAAAVLAGLRVDAARMARVAREGFTNAADVADVLAADGGMDYRTAHKIVGLAVRRLLEDGEGALTAEAVAAAALELTGDRGRRRPRAARSRSLRAGASPGRLVLARVDGGDARRGRRRRARSSATGRSRRWPPRRPPSGPARARRRARRGLTRARPGARPRYGAVMGKGYAEGPAVEEAQANVERLKEAPPNEDAQGGLRIDSAQARAPLHRLGRRGRPGRAVREPARPGACRSAKSPPTTR